MAGEPWIDGLSRALARGTARREALRWLGRGLAGVTLGALLPERVSAGPLAQVCLPPEVPCGGRCTSLNTDPKNCGACGRRCGRNEECLFGCLCKPGFCRDAAGLGPCTPKRNDPDHCGTCRNVCPGGPNATRTCRNGQCGLTCTKGFGNCDGNPATGCEADLRSDPEHCGRCGRACEADQVCIKGKCQRLECDPLGFDDGAFCPIGFCCSKPAEQQKGVCVRQCPSGQCCSPELLRLCVPNAECPDGGCCDANGVCAAGTTNTACGSGTQCVDCTQGRAGNVCLSGRTCGCNSDADCAPDFFCDTRLNTCVPACSPNNPCPPGECCNEFGRCVGFSRPGRAGARRLARGADGTCTAACDTTADCGLGEVCCNGTCCAECCGGVCCDVGRGCCNGVCCSRRGEGCVGPGGSCSPGCPSGGVLCADEDAVTCCGPGALCCRRPGVHFVQFTCCTASSDRCGPDGTCERNDIP